MKNIINIVMSFLLGITYSNRATACTCLNPPRDFYSTIIRVFTSSPPLSNFYILKCVRAGELPSNAGSRLTVLEQYYGNTTVVDTIIFREGNGTDCHGWIPQFTQDTLIVALYMSIGTNEAYSPSISDGQFVNSMCGNYTMAVQNDSAYGWHLLPGYSGFSLSGLQDSINKLSEGVLSTNEMLQKNPIIIYPNPATDMLHIEVLDNAIFESIFIQDLRGVTVFNYMPSSKTKQIIDVSHLCTGLYVLTLRYKDGSVKQHKMMKE